MEFFRHINEKKKNSEKHESLLLQMKEIFK